jgi:hypothetical protein
MGPESDPLCQFLAPENFKMSQYRFNWIFLVSIELIHNPDHVQIVSFFSYWPEIWKQILGPEADERCQFLGPETDP